MRITHDLYYYLCAYVCAYFVMLFVDPILGLTFCEFEQYWNMFSCMCTAKTCPSHIFFSFVDGDALVPLHPPTPNPVKIMKYQGNHPVKSGNIREIR